MTPLNSGYSIWGLNKKNPFQAFMKGVSHRELWFGGLNLADESRCSLWKLIGLRQNRS